jgi:predicted O-methyltransferase YrrM
MFRWLFRRPPPPPPTRAAQIAAEDAQAAADGSRFAHGTRPLIRWTIAAGQGEHLLREAVFLTTAALGDRFDYALCSSGIGALRAREMLELSSQPVEWRAVDKSELSARLRPTAPELALPSDVAVQSTNVWLEAWAQSGAEPRHHAHLPLAALPPAGNEPSLSRPFSEDEIGPFTRLQSAPRRLAPDLVRRFAWLASFGQWGVPGWSMPDALAQLVVRHAAGFAGRTVLELGTSRGRLTAMLAGLGCRVVTVDHQDRGARANLEGLSVEVVQDELARYLERTRQVFELVVCDLHGNAPSDWRRYRKPLLRAVAKGGMLILNNAALHRLEGWESETGVSWFLSRLPADCTVELHVQNLPGIAIVRRR